MLEELDPKLRTITVCLSAILILMGCRKSKTVTLNVSSGSEKESVRIIRPQPVFPMRVRLDWYESDYERQQRQAKGSFFLYHPGVKYITDSKEFEVKDIAELMGLLRHGYHTKDSLREVIPPLYPRLGASLVTALVSVVEDEKEPLETRGNAIAVLAAMKAHDAIPAIVKLLKHPILELDAHDALKEMGKPAVPALADALKDKSSDVRRYATYTLRDIGSAAEGAVPSLIDALKDDDRSVRIGAVDALGSIGPNAKAAVPALNEAMKAETGTDGTSENIRTSITVALKKIGGE